jgi:hypothetical protein
MKQPVGTSRDSPVAAARGRRPRAVKGRRKNRGNRPEREDLPGAEELPTGTGHQLLRAGPLERWDDAGRAAASDQAVAAAGGETGTLPTGAATSAAGSTILVLAGGADVDPGGYGGAAAGSHTSGCARTATPAHLARDRALAKSVPLTADCRGMQLLNVVARRRRPGPACPMGPAPTVTTRQEPDATGPLRARQPYRAAAGRAGPHCHHHQALDRVADPASPSPGRRHRRGRRAAGVLPDARRAPGGRPRWDRRCSRRGPEAATPAWAQGLAAGGHRSMVRS